MPVEICNCTFQGPYLTTSPVQNEPGVYIVLGAKDDGQFRMVDTGEADDVRSRLDNHDRRECWDKFGFTKLAVAVHYISDQSARKDIARQIHSAYEPPCSKQE